MKTIINTGNNTIYYLNDKNERKELLSNTTITVEDNTADNLLKYKEIKLKEVIKNKQEEKNKIIDNIIKEVEETTKEQEKTNNNNKKNKNKKSNRNEKLDNVINSIENNE